MSWILSNIRWIMILSGALTVTMVQAAVAPEAALESQFGETLSGPLANVLVRNWGALVALIGGMLIYAAFRPPERPLVLFVAAASKIVFISLVLSEGERYLSEQVGLAVLIDSIMVALFVWYLAAVRRLGAKTTPSPPIAT
jgi:hypothetical protein